MKQTNDDDVLMQIEGINVKEFSKEEYEFYFNNAEFFRRILNKAKQEATAKLIQEIKDKIKELEEVDSFSDQWIRFVIWFSEKEKELKE